MLLHFFRVRLAREHGAWLTMPYDALRYLMMPYDALRCLTMAYVIAHLPIDVIRNISQSEFMINYRYLATEPLFSKMD